MERNKEKPTKNEREKEKQEEIMSSNRKGLVRDKEKNNINKRECNSQIRKAEIH